MLIEFYNNGKVILEGKGVNTVDDSFGEYLVKTFPKWFKKVEEDSDKDLDKKVETKEKKLRKRAKKK